MNKQEYKTKQRAVMLEVLQQNADVHFTVDSMCELLQKQGYSIGRTTVYRFLEKLNSKNRVRKYSAVGGSACYQYVVEDKDCQEHFHLKCQKCGNLIHAECDMLNTLGAHIKSHHGFLFDPLNTVFYGFCEGCCEK